MNTVHQDIMRRPIICTRCKTKCDAFKNKTLKMFSPDTTCPIDAWPKLAVETKEVSKPKLPTFFGKLVEVTPKPPSSQPKPKPIEEVRLADKIHMVAATWTDWIKNKGKNEEIEEVKRRADICRGCEFNIAKKACGTCAAKDKLITTLFNIKKDEQAAIKEGLGSCGVCGCKNDVHVFVPLGILQDNVPEELNNKFPDHCWKKKKA